MATYVGLVKPAMVWKTKKHDKRFFCFKNSCGLNVTNGSDVKMDFSNVYGFGKGLTS